MYSVVAVENGSLTPPTKCQTGPQLVNLIDVLRQCLVALVPTRASGTLMFRPH